MLECDFITASNEFVADSARMAGIPEHRILDTSYGFSPSRLSRAIGIVRPKRPPVFAFVGTGSVPKGLDVLLEAWEKAEINGKLLLAGRIDAGIQRAYARTLGRDDIKQLGFVQDIAAVYAAADVFVFPSHQEGGPQVTYEAAACGLPCIVSPMGKGRLVRHEVEGLVVDPCNVDQLAAAMTRVAQDETFQKQLAANAESRALEFTWARVAARRYKQFSEAVKSR
jgi:glycosyltransferase involved in cell wall biosynthesis